LIAVLLLSLAACQSQPQPQQQPEADHVAEARKLLDAGKTKEAYEYLYAHRDNAKAAEMLTDFLVLRGHIDANSYSVYNAKRVTDYNEHGELIREEVTYSFESPDGQSFLREYEITYDSKGNKLESVETLDGKENRRETYTYNDRGLLHIFKAFYSESSYKTETYTYDEAGNPVLTVTAYSDNDYVETLECSYDESGNLLTEKLSYTGGNGGDSGLSYEYLNTYDEEGKLIRRVHIMGGDRPTTIDTSYTYNPQGDLILETDQYTVGEGEEAIVGNTIETSYQYTYDHEGRITKKITETAFGSSTSEYTYNEQGDLICEKTVSDLGAVQSSEFAYVYSENGEISRITEVKNSYRVSSCDETYDEQGNLTSQQSVSAMDTVSNSSVYTYDDLNRPIQKVHTDSDGRSYTYTYEYDERNNLTKKTRTYPSGTVTTFVYTYDDMNREIKSVVTTGKDRTVTEREYDHHGNVIKRTETASGKKTVYEYVHQYDEKGNLVKTEDLKDGTLSATYVREYDGAGREIKRTGYSAENKIFVEVTKEYEEDGNLLREISTSGESGASVNAHEIIKQYDEYGVLVYEYFVDSYACYENLFSEFTYLYLPDRIEID
jgi:hypothetical protein